MRIFLYRDCYLNTEVTSWSFDSILRYFFCLLSCSSVLSFCVVCVWRWLHPLQWSFFQVFNPGILDSAFAGTLRLLVSSGFLQMVPLLRVWEGGWDFFGMYVFFSFLEWGLCYKVLVKLGWPLASACADWMLFWLWFRVVDGGGIFYPIFSLFLCGVVYGFLGFFCLVWFGLFF